MPSFDWMKEDKFKDEIKEQVIRTAVKSGMEKYQEAIVERLVDFLIAKREEHIMQESLKVSYRQRTKDDALHSVDVLLKDACSYAKADKRTTVTQEDFDKAYRVNFCMVWPFC